MLSRNRSQVNILGILRIRVRDVSVFFFQSFMTSRYAAVFINIRRKNNVSFLVVQHSRESSERINKISDGLAFTCGTSHTLFRS